MSVDFTEIGEESRGSVRKVNNFLRWFGWRAWFAFSYESS
jgi:hypothetical protein